MCKAVVVCEGKDGEKVDSVKQAGKVQVKRRMVPAGAARASEESFPSRFFFIKRLPVPCTPSGGALSSLFYHRGGQGAADVELVSLSVRPGHSSSCASLLLTFSCRP